ncbi:hypothetical protein GCM10023189_45430 [Nibrella saemangeumensis]|uniref:Heavy metal binding domain-containing protein n=2 Tax=Nibrella saemangeumensis TaxID=1084526 RepID=A0ABP8NET8_9BACT
MGTGCDSNQKSQETTTTVESKQEPGSLAAGETFTCPMHPEVMSDNFGHCPKCGMNLEKQKMTAEQVKMKQEGTFVKSREEQQ